MGEGRTQVATWDDRVESHQAIQLMESVAKLVGELEPPDDSTALESLERIKSVVAYISTLIENTDAQLVTALVLDRMLTPASSLQSVLQSFKNGGAVSYLDDANTYLDQLLDALSAWPHHGTVTDNEGVRKSAQALRSSVAQLTRNLENETKTGLDEVEALRQQITEAKTDLSAEIEDVKGTIAPVEAQVESQKSALSAALTQHEELFRAAQTQREEESKELTDKLKSDYEAGWQQMKTNFQEALTTQQNYAGERIDEIEGFKAKAEELLGAIGKTGTTFGFSEHAKGQGKQANLWRGVVVAALLLIAIIGIWIVKTTHGSDELEVARVLSKAFITIPLAFVAAYASKQSQIHRELERESRRLELDISAIDPYIQLLPESERVRIKAAIALKVFGRNFSDTDGSLPLPFGAEDVAKIVKELVKDQPTPPGEKS